MIRAKDVFSEAYGALRKNRRRTAITMLGMAWGIATVVLLLAYGTGFATAIVNIFQGLCQHAAVAGDNWISQARYNFERKFSHLRVGSRRSDVSQNQSSRSCGVRHGSRLSCSSRSSSQGSNGTGGWSLLTCRYGDERCRWLC